MKTLLTLIFVLAMATGAFAQETHCYGWENGGVVLSEYGSIEYSVDGTNVTEGSSALMMRETGSGSASAYVCWITGFADGDEITATMDVFDDTPEGYPSARFWGIYSLATDIDDYEGSASGPSAFSAGTGWENQSWTWTMDGTKEAFVVQARPYASDPYDTGFNWIDNLCITVPEGCTVYFPGGVVDAEDAESWSSIKAMFQ